MTFKQNKRFSLKQIWTALVLFSVLIPMTAMTIWHATSRFDNQLSLALTIVRYEHELLRMHIESEITRFKTLLQNKSDPLTVLMEQVDSPKSLNEINNLILNIKKILKFSISKGGSSIRDFQNALGKSGNFQQFFHVYGRKNKNCSRISCKGKIKKIQISHRSSFYCNKCQN